MEPDPKDPPIPDAAEVAAFLRANPRWLAANPDLYIALAPPVRVHGETLADHMAAMLELERARATAMAEQANGVLTAGRAAASLTGRVQEAVLALMRAHDPIDCIAQELPGVLGVDAAALCVEGQRAAPGTRVLPMGAVNRLLGGREVVARSLPRADVALLHAEAALLARHDALLRVPLRGVGALIALAARDATVLDAASAGGALAFLGRAAAAALER
jgi:uncharacterized protein YigA (DUF484 family)